MKKEITNAFKWDLIGKIGNQSVGFVISIILARLLVPEDFGLLAVIVSFSSLVSGFVNLGFSSAIIQSSKVNKNQLNSVFVLNLTIGLSLTVLFFLCSNFIAEFYDNDKIISISKVFSLTFVINSFGLVSMALLQKAIKFKEIMLVNLFSGLISGIVGLLLAFMDYGVWAIVIQSLLNEFLRAILSVKFSDYSPQFYFSIKSIKPLWSYGAPLFISGLFNSIFSKIDYLIIGKFFPAALLGLLYRAKSFRTLIIRYTTESLGKVLFPVFSKKQDDIAWISNTVSLSLKLSFYLILFFSILLFTIGEEMFIILFSEKWLGAVPFFKILILSSVTFPMITILGNVLIGLGKSKRYLFLDSFEKIGLLIGIILAVYKNNLLLYLYIDFFVRLIAVGIFFARVEKLLIFNKKEILFSFFSSLIISVCSFYSVNIFLSILSTENIWLIIIFKAVVFISCFYILSKVDQKLQKRSNLFLTKSLIKNYK
jgi:teichuronic acid exporter